MKLEIAIDRTSDVPLYRQIVLQVRDLIVQGDLRIGTRLPPERRLADELGVNRSTVLSAYAQLKREGFLEARVGRGTSVAHPLHEPGSGAALPWRHLFRRRSAPSPDPLLRDLLALCERDDIIPMAIGLPAPESIPVDLYRDLVAELADEIGPALLLHCPTEGITSLRAALVRWAAARGIVADPAEVLVLSGSQQGLDIAARVLVEPGDAVVVEEPTYIGALQVFRAAGADVIGVPVDADGMRTDLLEDMLARRRPRLIYTLPTYQNPSGSVMSLERRRHLLKLAYRHQVPILEDDPYSDLRYDGDPPPSLKALDERGLVLHLATASKILFPGMRLGWLIAPEPAAHRFALAKQGMDLHSNAAGQHVLARMLERGLLDAHLEGVRRLYAQRRDLMLEMLERGAPRGVTWNRPAGGLYVWCELPPGIERARLMAQAAEAGVSFLPGWLCYAEDPGRASLRLNFSFPDEARIRAGMARLLGALRRCTGRRLSTRRHLEAGTPPIV